MERIVTEGDKNKNQNLRDLWNHNKRSSICVIRIQKERKKRVETKRY